MASISASVELYDRMSAPLYAITNAMNQAVSTMYQMDSAMDSAVDTSSLIDAMRSINSAIDGMDNYKKMLKEGGGLSSEPVQIPVEWVTPDTMDIFTNSGIDRFQQEIQSANTMANQLLATQQSIGQQAANTDVFSDTAVTDMENLGNRIQTIQERIQELESNPLELDDRTNNQLEVLRSQLTSAIQEQNNLNQAVADLDVSSANESFARLQQTVGNTERYIRDNLTQPVQIPVEIEWNGTGVDVFSGTGIERFRQEVVSTNQMLTTLSDKQNQIAQNAAGTNIFSSSAMQDINSMGQRIQAVQQRIQQIENNPVNLGTDTANAELEQLRSQLNQAIQAQEAMNQAVQNMDVSAANAAYNQLSSTIANTERYIRDNADAQGNLNQQIQAGVDTSNELVDTVKRLATAYLSIQGVQGILDVSDELVSTTARIDQMNDGLQSTDTLIKMVYVSAQDARGSFNDMAAVVAKFGNNAKDAFSSSEEVVQFANLIQKQMTIAGASTTEASNAMLQLSQALGSGVLRGDELNSIFEQAPNLIQSIADYLDVPIGDIREMASEGELTADIVKAAIFASADDINAKFEQMPMTWNQVWTSFQNSALIAFQPVLDKINELANNDQFQVFVDNAISLLAVLAVYVLDFFDTMASIATFISDNWSVIAPIVYGVIAALAAYAVISGICATATGIMAAAEAVQAAGAALAAGKTFLWTVQQYGLNAALAACPITWIILLIIALIAVIFAVCSAIAKMTGVANSGFGVITGGVNVVIQFFKNLGLEVANIALGIGNALAAVASNMKTAFNNAICSVQSWFYDLLSTALTTIAGIAEALNKLPFVEFDYSGITSAANDYAAKASEAAGNKEEYTSISDAFNEGMSTFDTFQDGWASDAFNAGASWGDGVADKVSNLFSGGMDDIDLTGGIDTSFLDSSNMANSAAQTAANTADTADTASAIADSVDISDENLKYLRDIAETEAINRFTTAEISVNMTNNNNVSSGMDIDGMVDNLSAGVLEAMEQAAEGVH
jgi:tape measure domain-containing protein